MEQFKFGDKVRIVIEGTINEIITDSNGIKYWVTHKDSTLSSARNPATIERIEDGS